MIEVDKTKPIIPALVDFDGTLVVHQYPVIGKENEHCIETMKQWTKDYNVGWILWTMRSDDLLQEAVDWIEGRGIKLYGINRNPDQESWAANTHKAYGYLCIDDINCGTPLIFETGKRPRVDWMSLKPRTEDWLKSIVKHSHRKISK